MNIKLIIDSSNIFVEKSTSFIKFSVSSAEFSSTIIKWTLNMMEKELNACHNLCLSLLIAFDCKRETDQTFLYTIFPNHFPISDNSPKVKYSLNNFAFLCYWTWQPQPKHSEGKSCLKFLGCWLWWFPFTILRWFFSR